MDNGNAFAHHAGSSLLHELDVRCKLICISLMSLSLLKATIPALSGISLLLFMLMIHSGIHPWEVVKNLKYFLVLLVLIFISRTMTTGGEAMVTFMEITITKEGIFAGTMVVWRFFLVMISGILFTVTTRPSHVKVAVQWFLAPIPFIPEKRAGVMVSLFLRFLPLMVQKSRQVAMAQKSRCGHLEKNPVKRVKHLALPLLKNMVQSADGLALGMTCRGYTEDRTELALEPSGREIPVMIFSVFMSALILI
ncbi:biotin transport system permease protein [Desulfocicer vacuolatum DSM 3385]|uniref:Biotin transport system permease protein n=1 Tax=Desulfocicer vacuolatum DSM 3385 TaxID=1121400 RepID=A0A1W2BSX8_9BACT|nr:energy-coupling factor transporter transmembrane component T [Desulfocicer vacuolatum]SMC75702.1 biotin transport system permease protein [Desulfocicer vacuolatum DSM 3385]